MEVRATDNPEADRYVASADGEPAGFLSYRLEPGRIELLHTEVDDAFEGQGIGGALAREALDDARRRGLDVLPFCQFVRGYIAKHPEYLDLVPVAQRARFEL